MKTLIIAALIATATLTGCSSQRNTLSREQRREQRKQAMQAALQRDRDGWAAFDAFYCAQRDYYRTKRLLKRQQKQFRYGHKR